MTAGASPALAGTAADLEPTSAFEWYFSQPFSKQSPFTPARQVLPPIEDERPIFVDEASGRHLSFGRLREDAITIGSSLQAMGLSPADTRALPPTPTCRRPEVPPVVLIQLPNCLAFAPLVMGTLAAGLSATLVSPALTASEVSWVLLNVRPHFVVTSTTSADAMREAISSVESLETPTLLTVDLATDSYPLSPSCPRPGASDWKRLLAAPSSRSSAYTSFAPAQRAAVILWSSGTSGRAKGVLLSHHSCNFATASLWHDADYHAPGLQQRWLGYVPFYHVYGFSNLFLLAIATGSTVYTMPAFKLDALLAAIPRRRITYLHMAPPVAVLLAKSPAVTPQTRRHDANEPGLLSSILAGVTGGAPLAHSIIQQVHERLGFRIRLGYGLTEACGGIALQRGLTQEDTDLQKGNTGTAHWGVEMMIASDDEKGEKEELEGGGGSAGSNSRSAPRPAAIGGRGEVLVRSPGLLMAYLPPPASTTAATGPDMSMTAQALTTDGWYRTGDVGTIALDGSLTITDRIKELIKVKGFQVAPAELEAILCSHDSVADAGVVGIHDEVEGTEWPRAFVVVSSLGKDDEPTMRDLAWRLRLLVEGQTAKYKWLRGGIVFIDQVPKSPSGKILRRVLKEGRVMGFEVDVYEGRSKRPKL